MMKPMVFPDHYLSQNATPIISNTSVAAYSSLFMIGDSLMKNQFMSLAYLKHTESFMPHNVFTTIHDAHHKDNGMEDYHTYFVRTNNFLSPYGFCDCHRDFYWMNVYENRYYVDASRNISIASIHFVGDKQPIRGQWLPNHPLFSNDSLRQPLLDEAVPVPLVNWNFTLQEYLLHIVPTFLTPKPKTILLNAGMWLNSFGDSAYADSVIAAAKSSFDRVIWKTTNCRRSQLGQSGIHRPELRVDSYMCERVECFNIDWTCDAKPDDMVDHGHFQYWVYNKINEQFMQHLDRKPLDLAVWKSKIIQVNSTESWPGPAYHGSYAIGAQAYFFVDESGNLRHFQHAANDANTTVNSCIGVIEHKGFVIWSVAQLSDAVISGASIKDECREGSLVRGNGKAVYVIQNNTLRAFSSVGSFTARGHDFSEVTIRSSWLLNHMRTGPSV